MNENNIVPVSNQVEEDVIVVNDGLRLVKVQNSLGEVIGQFKFNPTDINIVNRYNEISEQFGEVVKPLENASITSDGEGADDDSVAILNKAEEKMIELMDYMMNCDSRAAFFSKTHLFTPTGGAFYCENVINAIGDFITAKFDSEVKKVNARIDKHTHGYRTGKHRKGDR